MTVAQPHWFWALALLPLLLALFIRNERQRGKLLRQLVAARLLDRLAGTVSVGQRRLRFAVLLLGVACVIVSLAQPRLGYTWEQSQRKGRDLLLAVDVSKSMLANDVAPNRLARAKLAAQDFLSQLQGDRVGLIAFAGSAFLQAPLTVDYSAVLDSLEELDPEIIPVGGSNIGATIRVAAEAFGKGESDSRALVIFSDGEELDADGVTEAMKQDGQLRIFTVGLGTAEGALIPVPGASGGTAFVKDERGQFVKSRLDETRLRKIAEATGGFYVHLQTGPAEMTQIIREGLGKMTEQDIDAKMSRQPIERYQWPLAAGLLLLGASMLIGERRRTPAVSAKVAAVLVLVGGLLFPSMASAKTAGLDAYERGVAAAEKEDWTAAEKEFGAAYQDFAEQLKRRPDSAENRYNLGTAAYRLRKREEALEAFSTALLTQKPELQFKAEQNLGHTLYQIGKEKLPEKPEAKPDPTQRAAALQAWKDGLKHYDAALKIRPDDKVVQGNREYLRQRIAELERVEEPPKQDEQKKEEQEKKDQEQKDEEKKDQQDQKQGDQKKPQSGQDQKDEKGQPGEKSKEQEKKDGPPKDGQDGQPENKPQEDAKPGEEKPGEEKSPAPGAEEKQDPAQQGKNTPGQKDEAKEPPAPVPEPPGEKPQGELKANPSQPQPAQDAQAEAAAEEAAAAAGQMTEQQAKSLLESLRSEDERVRLINPNERKRAGRVLRDW